MLVVIGHVLDGFEKSGYWGHSDIAVLISRGITVFHMPLFIAVSGYVFALAYLERVHKRKEIFQIKEMRKYRIQIYNLAVIYLLFSVLMFGVKFVCSNWVNEGVEWSDLLKIPIRHLPDTSYWYLYVLCILYIAGAFLMRQSWDKNIVLLFLFILCVFYKSIQIPEWTTIQLVFYYGFFFIWGCLFQIRKRSFLGENYWIQWAAGILGMAVILFQQDMRFENMFQSAFIISIVKVVTAVFLVNASLGTALKYSSRRWIMCFLGKRSLEIYTLHSFITSGIRPLFKVLHMKNYWINAIAGIFLGIFIPVICSFILRKLNLWNVIYKPAAVWRSRKRRNI